MLTAPATGHGAFGADIDGCATRAVAGFLRGRLPACAPQTPLRTDASASGASSGRA
jgi:hypothetical protein